MWDPGPSCGHWHPPCLLWPLPMRKTVLSSHAQCFLQSQRGEQTSGPRKGRPCCSPPGRSRATAAQGQVWSTRNSQALETPRLTVPEGLGESGPAGPWGVSGHLAELLREAVRQPLLLPEYPGVLGHSLGHSLSHSQADLHRGQEGVWPWVLGTQAHLAIGNMSGWPGWTRL